MIRRPRGASAIAPLCRALAFFAMLCTVSLPLAGFAQTCVPPTPVRTKITFFELAFEQIQWYHYEPVCEAELVAGCVKELAEYPPAAERREALGGVKTKADVVELLERWRDAKVGAPDGPAAACIRGMTSILKGKAAFLDVAAYEAYFARALREQWGFEIAAVKEGARVTSVAEGTPAALASLAVGDILYEVGGVSVAGWDAMRIARRSLNASPIRISLKKADTGRTATISLKKPTPDEAPPAGRLLDGVAVITVQRVAPETAAQLIDLLARLSNENGGSLAGIVLDLRKGSGLDTQASTAVAALFLQPGARVFELVAWQRNTRFDVRAIPQHYLRYGASDPLLKLDPVMRTLPLLVLISPDTGLGAEVVAAGLRDNERAKLVGKPSAANVIETVIPIDDAFGALRLTTNYVRTSDGMAWQRMGLNPDVVVDSTAGTEDAALGAALAMLKK